MRRRKKNEEITIEEKQVKVRKKRKDEEGDQMVERASDTIDGEKMDSSDEPNAFSFHSAQDQVILHERSDQGESVVQPVVDTNIGELVSEPSQNIVSETEVEVVRDEMKEVRDDTDSSDFQVLQGAEEKAVEAEDEESGTEVARRQRVVRKRALPPRLREIVETDENGESYVLLNKISSKSISELIKLAYDLEMQNPTSLKRQELIMEIMRISYSEYGVKLYAEGIFQQIESGVGFLRLAHNNYLQSHDDVFVSKQLIKKYGIRNGDVVFGEIRPPEDETKGKYFSLQTVKSINFSEPWRSKERTLFENLIPYYPTRKFNLDVQFDGDISCRVVDIIAPIGRGQRGLIVSPPRAGKTMLMQNLAKSILMNHPEVVMIILLIDERPEEVTDWKKNILSKFKDRNVEVVAATFDEKPETHIKVADITLAKAKRLVEYKYDVVIFLDSITRLTRAYNQAIPSSGKVLTGGIDSAALQFPKKFFGAARAIEGGGSLTIIATCLIDTGSRMDEVIFEEFKGTGNMEIYLDRRIAEKRIFPAIDVHRSGTRKEELLIPPDILPKIWLLRKVLQPMTTIDAMELLYEKMSQTRDNEGFFRLLVEGG